MEALSREKVPYPDPPLSDGVVRLRIWQPSDLECVKEASCDPVIPGGTSVPVPFTEEEGLGFIERCRAHQTNGTGLALAITEAASDRAVGQLVLLLRRPPAGRHVAGIGYWVVGSARRRGFASRAVPLSSYRPRWPEAAGPVHAEHGRQHGLCDEGGDPGGCRSIFRRVPSLPDWGRT